jgi:hypothetical protein
LDGCDNGGGSGRRLSSHGCGSAAASSTDSWQESWTITARSCTGTVPAGAPTRGILKKMSGRQAEEMHFHGGAPAVSTTPANGENRTAADANGYAGSAVNGCVGSAVNGCAGSAANGYAGSAANGYAGSAANGYAGSAVNGCAGSSAKQVVFGCASRAADRYANPSIVDVSSANGGRSRGTGKGESGAENIKVVPNRNFGVADESPANGRLLFSEDSNRNSRFSSASAERGRVLHSDHTRADRVAAMADDGRARFNFYRPQEAEREQWSAGQSQTDVRAASNPVRMPALPARAAMDSGEAIMLASSPPGGYGRPAGTGNMRVAHHWREDQNEALGMNQRVAGRRDTAEAWMDGHNVSEQGDSNPDEPTGNRGDQ